MTPRFCSAALLFIVSARVFGGGTGEELLGSEELPVVWALALPESSRESIEEIERSFIPIELEIGATIDAAVRGSYSEVVELLRAGEAHIAVLPPLTFLLLRDEGVVAPGLIGEVDPSHRGSIILARNGFDPDSLAEAGNLRIARFDPLSHEGWLMPAIVLSRWRPDAAGRLEALDLDSTASVIEAVRSERADLGIAPVGAPAGIPELPDGVVEFARVEGPGELVIAFHRSVAPSERSRLVRSILDRSREGPVAPDFLVTKYGMVRILPAAPDYGAGYRLLVEHIGLNLSDLP